MKANRFVALAVSIAGVASIPAPVRVERPAASRSQAPVAAQQVTPASPRIAGTVLHSDRTPAAHVRLRLRNLDAGTIVGQTVSDANGGYSFAISDPGFYVVEAIDDDGSVLAVSNPASPGGAPPGTTVLLPARDAPAGFFASTGAVLAAAAGAGIAAWAIGARTAASPEQ
jgi:hypothetical protein